jgi:tRNA(Ile)-lysidine synthase
MHNAFSTYLHSQCGFQSGQRVLVALSGGADSVALLSLLIQLGVDVVVVHCNFNLRGEESDEDEVFVKELCENLNVRIYCKSFETTSYANEEGISIEMAARELRYGWFYELLEQEQLDYIATGHHQDDKVETFFLNLVRGTGIKGLSGMKPVYGKVIRPLLGFTRSEIVAYCQQRGLSFRTDSSNLESVYLRNKIRNEILPLFNEINPSFSHTMDANMDRLHQVNAFVQDSIQKIKEDWIIEQDDRVLISLKHIVQISDAELVLFEILQPYGFNGATIKELVQSIEQGIAGKQFFSSHYRIIKDRVNLIVLPLTQEDEVESYFIPVDEEQIQQPIKLVLEKELDVQDYTIDTSASVAQFDADLLEYPLTLRRWKQGDHFRPLGMKHFKKLSDFFIDQKFSICDKEEIWLLLSGDDIIWVVGHRTDDRYKITKKTNRVTKVRLV